MARLKTIKQIVSEAAIEVGMTQFAVTQVVGAMDQDITQMLAVMSAVADEVTTEEPYVSSLGEDWVRHSNGALDDVITADTDVILFDGRLAVLGVKYRYLKAKGLEYGEEMRDFLTRLNKLAHRQNAKVIDVYEDQGRQL